MIRRDILSWVFRPNFLRERGQKKEILFAGPWLGEFGWELLNWQSFLRWLSPQYKKIIVSCRKGNESLYADFCGDFIPHNIQGTAECNKALDIVNPEEYQRVMSQITDDMDHLPTVGWQPDIRKHFIEYGSINEDLKTDILFHPRGRNFGSDRNWSKEKWEQLLKKLQDSNLNLGCIGLSSATLDLFSNFGDYRNRDLSFTMDLLASTKLLIGPSSGPMHLASLCKTPHLVWTDTKKYARGRTNRQKYEYWWNPHKTTCKVVDSFGFDPPVEAIYAEILKFLEKKL